MAKRQSPQALEIDQRRERARIHLLLLAEAEKGLTDVTAGRTRDARQFLKHYEPARGKSSS